MNKHIPRRAPQQYGPKVSPSQEGMDAIQYLLSVLQKHHYLRNGRAALSDDLIDVIEAHLGMKQVERP